MTEHDDTSEAIDLVGRYCPGTLIWSDGATYWKLYYAPRQPRFAKVTVIEDVTAIDD